ncbi:MAG: DNA polymerase I [Candidatus Marinimicrobia bacterium]|nr:DNA polymerase I [Candidatus Neomarinimicrobiota bacterium]MCF7829683.1 DNA polymerase I [Candidatus Neomarinimicrobiota bacterium]MCF7879843.1 DNA polymerase I [Candidatus Neomarinimicrobiota bacterium]
MAEKSLYLIDGSALAYRAHFAFIRNPLTTTDGRNVSAIFGFTNSLLKILRDEHPDYIAVVFDTPEKTFRHEKYPEYKATREKMPDEMADQLDDLKKMTEYMNIPVIEYPGYEADDVMATLANVAEAEGVRTYLVTGDKDFAQLVNEEIYVYNTSGKGSDPEIWDRNAVKEKFGVYPEQIVDYLALMGDSSDNVPGVPGIGKKTARKLLNEYGTLEKTLEEAENLSGKRAREGLLENRDQALLSQDLVTIVTDAPIDEDFHSLQWEDFDYQNLVDFCKEFEFFSLIDHIEEFRDGEPEKVEKDYRVVTSRDELLDIVEECLEEDIVSVDLETTSVDPMQADIVGIAISWEQDSGIYIPVKYGNNSGRGITITLLNESELSGILTLEETLEILSPLFEENGTAITGQNIKYDILVLKCHDVQVPNVAFDTMIAAYLLKPEARSYKEDYLSMEYLGYQMQPIEELIGKRGKNQKNMADIAIEKVTPYAAEDADIALQLTDVLRDKLKDVELYDLFRDIELPLMHVLVQMEYNGVYVDREFLEEMSANLQKELDKLEKQIFGAADKEFNINSPQQLSEILFEDIGLTPIKKTKTGYSTNAQVLEELKKEHVLPGLILDYREISKLKSTYVDALPALIHPRTNRIHSNFNQTVAATGRLSSSDPNFQNIPIRTDLGREIRHAFVAEKEENLIMAADYSQIELRLMAQLSDESTLKEAFQNEEDIHSTTAALVFDVELENVTPDMRRKAKVVNFGIMYGAGPYRMSNELGISVSEGQDLINNYFEKYPGINNYITNTIAQARENKYVSTLFGRRRYLPDIDSSNRNVREAAERAAINMPIQGTAADMIKIAMVRLHKSMEEQGFRSKMILQIHDELVFEVEKDEEEALQSLVVETMERALDLDVPIVVDVGVAKDWYDAH